MTNQDESASEGLPRRLLRRWYVWAILPLAVVDWFQVREGFFDHPVWWMGALAALAVVGWLVEIGRTVMQVSLSRVPLGPASARVLILAGLALALGGGLVNWVRSVQGYVVLTELEAVPLVRGSHLAALDHGPLGDLEKLHVVLQMEEIDIRPTEDGRPYPHSRFRVQGADGSVTVLEVDPWTNAAWSDLRFYQGAFGFAPRIVLLSGEEELFDGVLPFTTVGQGAGGGVTFEGDFHLDELGLQIRGAVDLRSMDAGLQGHASLWLEVGRGERVLGRGRLRPGHFADLEDGYRVGFAGLEQWSEIDFSRRNYRGVMLVGFCVAVIGLAVLPVAHWRYR